MMPYTNRRPANHADCTAEAGCTATLCPTGVFCTPNLTTVECYANGRSIYSIMVYIYYHGLYIVS